MTKRGYDGDLDRSSADNHECSPKRSIKWFRHHEQKISAAPPTKQVQQDTDKSIIHGRCPFNEKVPENLSCGIATQVVPQTMPDVPESVILACRLLPAFSNLRWKKIRNATSTNLFELHTSLLLIVLMCFWPRKVVYISERWHSSRRPSWRWRTMDSQIISHFRSLFILHFRTWTGGRVCPTSEDMPLNSIWWLHDSYKLL